MRNLLLAKDLDKNLEQNNINDCFISSEISTVKPILSPNDSVISLCIIDTVSIRIFN